MNNRIYPPETFKESMMHIIKLIRIKRIKQILSKIWVFVFFTTIKIR